MSDKRRTYPVTVVHEAFTPTPEANEALQGFFREGAGEDGAALLASGLYSTARRLLDMEVHRKFHQYDGELQTAKRALATEVLAGEVLRLSGRTNVRMSDTGHGRLYVEVSTRDQRRFDTLTSCLDGIGDAGETLAGGDCLYADIPADMLVRSDEEREYARFLAQRKAQRAQRVAVGSPRIVERDVLAYPLKRRLPKRKKAYEEVA